MINLFLGGSYNTLWFTLHRLLLDRPKTADGQTTEGQGYQDHYGED